MATLARIIAVAALIGFTSDAGADEQRARVNYMTHCQGCHLPEAVGYPGKVPRMRDFIGYFLHSREGREFIIRVPGVSTTSLPDDQVTELMNWLLLTYSAPQLPKNFVPFTVDEVAALRPNPEPDPEKTRNSILERIAAEVPALAQELKAEIH
jgi:mono/diheme cytochrome c family protein